MFCAQATAQQPHEKQLSVVSPPSPVGDGHPDADILQVQTQENALRLPQRGHHSVNGRHEVYLHAVLLVSDTECEALQTWSLVQRCRGIHFSFSASVWGYLSIPFSAAQPDVWLRRDNCIGGKHKIHAGQLLASSEKSQMAIALIAELLGIEVFNIKEQSLFTQTFYVRSESDKQAFFEKSKKIRCYREGIHIAVNEAGEKWLQDKMTLGPDAPKHPIDITQAHTNQERRAHRNERASRGKEKK